ncbi:hypothetical protein ElyMa_007049400 [Elysia marginata]|uniref:Uncharacterized protein n=1 Tax=Elysia marginata TaxID=1093978 RepID=A0AAV4JWB7_9GAST|nr:hypothetical protein ElyMa_007049400 [Elysia marginata]
MSLFKSMIFLKDFARYHLMPVIYRTDGSTTTRLFSQICFGLVIAAPSFPLPYICPHIFTRIYEDTLHMPLITNQQCSFCNSTAAHHQRCSTSRVVFLNAICLISFTASSPYTYTAISMVNAESRFVTEYDTSPLDAISSGMFLGP